ncbi:MAG: hypothetical protein ACRBFS_07640 [Aureispira sp.]
MAKLKVKHVGPIKAGLIGENEFIEFKGVTLFIGDQGSGKSTIAKLYSTLSWLEKALMRGDFSVEQFNARNGFKNNLQYQGIDTYLSTQSKVEYKGEAYHIKYNGKENKIQTKLLKKAAYNYPKIMYVPAERNFVSAIDKADTITLLPAPLFTFLVEYRAAKKGVKEKIKLPISNIQYRYNSNSDTSYIIGQDYEIDLLRASSGFQSMTPLYLVTRYLSDNINQELSIAKSRLSLKQKEQLEKIIIQTPIEWKRDWAEAKLNDQLQHNSFINVVVELEQNLYPSSQKQLLFSLIGYKNRRAADRLVLTTHSLYLLGYLGLCIKAHQLQHIIQQLPQEQTKKAQERLQKLVPLEAAINPQQLSLYQLNSDGSIESIQSKRGFPSEENDLNEAMMEANDLFTDLLELQQKWQ